MGLFNNLLANFGYKRESEIEPKEIIREKLVKPKQKSVGEFFPSPILGTKAPDWKLKDYLEASAGWVYACVGVISDEIGNIDLKLFRRTGSEVEEIFDHPLLDLLSKVNDITTKFDHFSMTQQYLELTGEAPWYLDKDSQGNIENILLLRPDKLSIIYSKDKDNIIEGYRYLINEEQSTYKDIPADDLILLRYPDPVKPLTGTGPLKAASVTVDVDTFSEEWNKNFFYNSAAPDAVLEADGQLTETQFKRLRTQWKQRFQGIANNFKMAILEGGIKYSSITPKHTDMDFMEQQKFTRDKIFGIFRVPKAILAQTDGVNLANAKVSEQIFSRWTIQPKMQKMIEQLNEFLVPYYGEDIFLDFESPVKEDREQNRLDNESGIKNGYLTPNEVRTEIGKDEMDGGDDLYMAFNMQPIAGREENEEVPEKALDVRYRHKRGKPKTDKKALAKDIKELATAIVKNGNSEKEPTEKQMGEIFWKGLIKRTDVFEDNYKRILKNYFNRQKREVVKQVEKKSKKAEDIKVDEDFDENLEVKFNVEKESEILKKLSVPFLAVVLTTIGKDTKKFWDLPPETQEVNVASYITTRIKFIKGVNETTKKRLETLIQKGIDEGEGVSKISTRIQNLFKDFTKARSDAIARSEVLRAGNHSILETFKKSGVVKGKKWVTAMDERVCPWCNSMEGKTLPLSTNFFDKGDALTVKDQKGKEVTLELDYEPIEAGNLHTSCRCIIEAVK